MQHPASANDMLSYLILEQNMSKLELSRVIRAPTQEISKASFKEHQEASLARLYRRIKLYEKTVLRECL